MGRVEKLVVLAVLFAITAILVVSMNTRGSTPTETDTELLGREGRGDGWNPAEDLLAGRTGDEGTGRTASDDGAATPAPKGQAPIEPKDARGGAPTPPLSSTTPDAGSSARPDASRAPVLLTSEIDAPAPPPADEPREIPADWDLRTLEGLDATLDPSTMLYTCRAGDTFETVAARFYGDAAKAELLQRNNEGLRELSAGRAIFVPARDDTALASATTYVVQDGDNLWGIAKKVYGKGSRWEEIFDANHALLSTPDALRAGMVLRIP